MKLLDEILSDYPRIWEYYKHETGERGRAPKYAQRYPVPMGTLSMVLDFHKWTHSNSKLVSEVIAIRLPCNVQPSASGPDPLVIARLVWLTKVWSNLEVVDKNLAKTLDGEVDHWSLKIRQRLQGAAPYKYLSGATCQYCATRSVVQYEDSLMCINAECRDPMTGEWRTWQM
jgi:hypothetical protein